MAANTRDIILETAYRLFVKQGFTATSIRQLAEEAKIGKATIYHHFNDKQSIALALLDQELDVNEEDLFSLRLESDPHRRIEAIVLSNIARFQQSMELILVIQREVPIGRKRLDAKFLNYRKIFTALLAETIKQGQAEGLFRDVDVIQAAEVLLTMIFGFVHSPLALTKAASTPKEGAATLLDFFFYGIEV